MTPKNGKKVLKICQVNSVVAEVYGGPSIGSVALNSKLRELGVDAVLYGTNLNGAPGSRISSAEEERYRESGAVIELFESTWPSSMQNGRGFLRSLIRIGPDSDLFHLDGQYQLPLIYGYFVARWFKVPYGIQAHGSLEPYQRAKSRLKKWIYGAVIGNRILREATYVHFASASEAERARDVVRPDQEVIVPLGASLPAEKALSSLSNLFSETERNERVLFLGRLTHKKRPDLLLEAWAQATRSRNSVLIIAGPDEDVTAAELRRLASILGVAESVVFTGQVTGPEKSWLYRNCGTFVLASENENFALTVGEAMLGGCHVIASTGVAASEFLVLAESGRVLADMNVRSLSNAVSEALANDDVTARSGRRAAAYADEHLSWRPLASALAEIAGRTRKA
ncbi:glycosyltransferase [Arthrobacter sp. 754]|uniref:glycosyltransferase n=1 Tax=Arthrobacter sp. 754 TaxID=3156315 RepID=UPI003396D383